MLKKADKEKLNELIPSYAENKEKLDAIDKVCKAENAEIKKLMVKDHEYSVDDYTAKITIKNKDTVDEELLCVKLSAFPKMYELGIIKVQEYVDMSALEDAMYKKELTEEMLKEVEKCRNHKEIVELRVTKKKKAD